MARPRQIALLNGHLNAAEWPRVYIVALPAHKCYYPATGEPLYTMLQAQALMVKLAARGITAYAVSDYGDFSLEIEAKEIP